MQSGTIVRLLLDKGFGFIRDERGSEHFFHRGSVRGAVFELLREGQRALSLRPKNRRKDRVQVMCAWSTNEPAHRFCWKGRDGINATPTR
jgi:cold shock CspA family protein